MSFGLAVALWFVATVLMVIGNTAGYHRLLTHRSFETGPTLRLALTLLSALHSGSPVQWVGVHRVHHAFTETDLDPHSPNKGFWYAHCGWLLGGVRHPLPCILFAISGFGLQAVYLTLDVLRLLGRVKPTWRRMSRDLMTEPVMVALDTPLVIPALFALQLAAAWAIGEWHGVLWLWLLHVVQNNLSWVVNSVCHHPAFGRGVTDAAGTSRNVAWLGWLTLGEAFHGHHHRHPNSARHALDGRLDLCWLFICVMHRAGQAHRIKLPAGHAVPGWAMPSSRAAS